MKLLIILLLSACTCTAQTYTRSSIDDGSTVDYYHHDITISRAGDTVLFTGPTYKYTYVLIRNHTYRQLSSARFEKNSLAFITFGDTVTICQFYKSFTLISKYY
jgi:hypothetical protein